jgi:hypothetical protein
MTRYKVTPEGDVYDSESSTFIPRYTVEYLEWCKTNTPEVLLIPGVHIPEKVQKVTMRQARIALFEMNLLDYVNQYIDSVGGKAKIEWEYASDVERHNDLIKSFTMFTEEQLDDLFLLASTK